MSFPRYPKYKDSGVDGWGTCRSIGPSLRFVTCSLR